MKRHYFAPPLAALVVMIWGFIFWAGGGASLGFSSLAPAEEDAVRSVLMDAVPETGTYVLPDPEVGSMDDWVARHLAGPLAFVHVTKAGTDPMAPSVYLMGFFHMLLTAILLLAVMRQAAAHLTSLGRRASFGAMVGLLVAFWSNLADPIWFYQPWPYHLVTSVYDVVAFSLMGLVLGRFGMDR